MKRKIYIIIIAIVLIAATTLSLPRILKFASSIYVKEAKIAAGKPDFAESEKCYLTALALYPENPDAISEIADLYYKHNEFVKASEYIERAVIIKPTARNYFIRGMIYSKLRDNQKAENSFKKALELDPNISAAKRQLALCLEREKKIDEATSLAEQFVKESPEDPDAYIFLYQIYTRQGKGDLGVAVLERGANINRPCLNIFFELFKYYQSKNDIKNIEKTVNSLLEKMPDEFASYKAAVYFYINYKHDYNRAEQILLEGKKRLPGNTEILFYLAGIYEIQKKYDKAADEIRIITLKSPNNTSAWNYLGTMLYDTGEIIEAEKAFKKSISLHEKQPEALNMLAWIYVTSPPGSPQYRPDKAVDLARRAVALAPENYAFIDTLARALYANKKYEESLEYYTKNLNRNKNVMYSYYGIAVCNFKLGNKEQGEKMLEQALNLGFNDARLIWHDRDIPEIGTNKRINIIIKNFGKEDKKTEDKSR